MTLTSDAFDGPARPEKRQAMPPQMVAHGGDPAQMADMHARMKNPPKKTAAKVRSATRGRGGRR